MMIQKLPVLKMTLLRQEAAWHLHLLVVAAPKDDLSMLFFSISLPMLLDCKFSF